MAAVTAGSVFSQKRGRADDLFPVPASAFTDFYLTHSHFEPLINTSFQIGGVQMTLREVTKLAYRSNELRGYYGESFSLLFEGPNGRMSGIHQLRHPALGEFAFFINSVGERGTSYEIIVNRIRK